MEVVNGTKAVETAKTILPPEIQKALDSRQPLAKIIALCEGNKAYEELVKKCYPLWGASPELTAKAIMALHYS